MSTQHRLETRAVDQLQPHPKNGDVYGDDEELTPDFIESIARHGVREPLVVTPDDVIVSGHRRWRVASLTALEVEDRSDKIRALVEENLPLEEVPVRVERYDSDLDEWEALVDYNRQRRKTPAQMINEAELLMEIERKRARDRQGHGETAPGENASGKSSISEGTTREKVGEQLGASGRTIEKGLRVKERAEEGDETAQEEWEKLQDDDQSIHGAYETVREESDDAGETKTDEDLGPTTHTCSVCGEEWTEWDLSDRVGERVDVDHVCVVSYPDDFVFHFPEGQP